MTRFPLNFISLHQQEEHLRAQSMLAIESNDDQLLHLDIIEAAMELCDVLRQFKTEDEDLKVIQLFGMRMFNAFAASIKLIMSGYYQKGGMIMRDILETVFLADFFRTDRAAIARYRFADKQERMKSFRPIALGRNLISATATLVRSAQNYTRCSQNWQGIRI
jgi:DNA-binding NtrC family response regulator